MGSILEGVPVIDYTTEGSRASRLQRWEKLQTDHEGLATARFQQALRYITHIPGPQYGPFQHISAWMNPEGGTDLGLCATAVRMKLSVNGLPDFSKVSAMKSLSVLRSEATAGNERPSSDPMRLRSAVADIAAAAIEGACGNQQALKLREGLSLPRRSTLADARAAAPSSSATQRMQARVPKLEHTTSFAQSPTMPCSTVASRPGMHLLHYQSRLDF